MAARLIRSEYFVLLLCGAWALLACFAVPDFASPELSPTMTYGTGIGGDKSVSVTGEVSGEAKVAVDINASSSLLDVVRRAEAAVQLSGRINSGGPGTLGLSSPDASASSPQRSYSSGGHH